MGVYIRKPDMVGAVLYTGHNPRALEDFLRPFDYGVQVVIPGVALCTSEDGSSRFVVYAGFYVVYKDKAFTRHSKEDFEKVYERVGGTVVQERVNDSGIT